MTVSTSGIAWLQRVQFKMFHHSSAAKLALPGRTAQRENRAEGEKGLGLGSFPEHLRGVATVRLLMAVAIAPSIGLDEACLLVCVCQGGFCELYATLADIFDVNI
ncbi:hypothetical protein MRX96_047150 [Rhipicephalus microplus]